MMLYPRFYNAIRYATHEGNLFDLLLHNLLHHTNNLHALLIQSWVPSLPQAVQAEYEILQGTQVGGSWNRSLWRLLLLVLYEVFLVQGSEEGKESRSR